MASPLVATKLYVPRLRGALVERDRVTARLRTTAEVKLTLVSAPAGFGKTTAVAAWLAASAAPDRVVAWVSLEQDDAEESSFWRYVVAALQSALPDIGRSILPLLESGQQPTRAVLATLINEIGDQGADIDLVLDDYHRADVPAVAEGMTYLLDHMPANLHVVVSTRADPDLPLARLRARGELAEVRARDLRFTTAEAAEYLAEVSGLAVDLDDVTTLADRTEGWAAALQLAALSMQGRDDVSGFVAGFAGDDRYVVDYLADEVLSRQPDDVREFLLRTCVLDRLAGELCDAVTGSAGGRAMLESLERANLFLVPLDDRRHWYRYHHLFADVLRAHLDADRPHEVPGLHLRAAAWFDAAGEPVPAVRHALAAGDLDRAAALVEAAVPALGRDRAEATLRAWADEFPDEVLHRRPLLALGLVGGLMQHNDFAQAEEMLGRVQRWVPAIRERLGLPPEEGPLGGDGIAATSDTPSRADVVGLDEQALARVPSTLHMYRAALALVHSEPAATLRHAELARAEAVPGDDLARGAAAALSGLALWSRGDLEAAHRWYSQSVDDLARAGHLSDVLGCTVTLADLRLAQGRIGAAQQAYDEGLALATSCDPALRGAADMHTGLAETALERGDLASARRELLTAQELGDGWGLVQNPYRSKAAAAGLAEAEGDLVTARELLVEAEGVYLGDFSPDVRPLHARIARIDIALGDLTAARRWAADHGMAPAPDLSYAREFEHVTYAEVLLAAHREDDDAQTLRDCRDLLARLLDQAEAGGRTATVIEVLVLVALAAEAGGDTRTAQDQLRRAVAIGQVAGHVRALARQGPRLAVLLDRVAATGGGSPYLDSLRAAALRAELPAEEGQAPLRRARTPRTGLVDPLSPRELDVLRLLASDLDGPDIARHLVVSLNTLRTHTKNIYAKLGVSSRRAALRRAHELGLPLSG